MTGSLCYARPEVSRFHPSNSVFALRREGDDDQAEVIDLVQLPRGTRPTPIAYLEVEEVDRCRVLSCAHYAACLQFAAQVSWKSFHCRQCPQHPERRPNPSQPHAPDHLGELIELP